MSNIYNRINMEQSIIPCGTNITRISHYKTSITESLFIDWVVIKHRYFGYREFNYSYKQIQDEIGIGKRQLATISDKFTSMGWLKVKSKGVKGLRTQKLHFDIDYPKLMASLSDIIDREDPKYFHQWENFILEGVNSSQPKQDEQSEEEDFLNELIFIWDCIVDWCNSNKDGTDRIPHIDVNVTKKLLSKIRIHLSRYSQEKIKDAFTIYAYWYMIDLLPSYCPQRPRWPFKYFFSDLKIPLDYMESYSAHSCDKREQTEFKIMANYVKIRCRVQQNKNRRLA